jgi:polysaccharide biosynthesis transport protein
MEHREYISEEIDLEKYWLVLKRRWFPATLVFTGIVTLAAVYASLQVPIYQATGKLLFRDDSTSSLTGLESETAIGKLQSLSQGSDPLATQAQIISSLPIAQATVEALDLKDEQGNLLDPQWIAGSLSVKPVAGTDIIQIAYKSQDPKLAAALVNQVMKAYIDNNVQTNRAEAIAAREFILQQLPETEAAVSRAEVAMRQFQEANGIVDLEGEASAAVANMSALDKQIGDAQAELADVSARSAKLRQQVGTSAEGSVALSSLNQSPGVQDALAQLQEVETQLANARTRYQSGHPAVATLERQETALKALLEQRVGQVLGRSEQVSVGNLQIGSLRETLIADFVQAEVERVGLTRRLNQLVSSETAYQARTSVIPGLEKTQRELDRRLNAAQTTYETLLTKLQEVQVTENQNIGNARVISEAQLPEEPVAPQKKIILAGGVFAGFLTAIALAFLLDFTDRSVKTLKEARELFNYTLLGVIPTVGKPDKPLPRRGNSDRSIPRIISRDFPHSPVQEAYQMLNANLKFLNSDKEPTVIVITSSVPKEGKSEVAASLAAAIAQVNRRVLLVDADMRHPSQHHAWGLTNRVGLSNLVVGQVKLSDAVQVVTSTLHILTAGVTPPNPLALLDSSRMSAFVQACSQDYDFVIFDTPALAGTADAAVIGKMTDGVLLVARPGVVDAASGKAAKEFLVQSGQTVLGIVVNGVNIKSEPDSYFYYSEEEQVRSNFDRSTASSSNVQD